LVKGEKSKTTWGRKYFGSIQLPNPFKSQPVFAQTQGKPFPKIPGPSNQSKGLNPKRSPPSFQNLRAHKKIDPKALPAPG